MMEMTLQDWKKGQFKKETGFIKEMKDIVPEVVKEARITYLIGQISKYRADIALARWKYRQGEKEGVNIKDRLCYWYMADIDRKKKKLKRYSRELIARLRGNEWNNGITEDMVMIARGIDISELVEVNRAGKIHCINPAHEDNNPSMLIKNGFGYCFSCGYRVDDSIDLLMKRDNLTFVQVVKSLNDRGGK